MSADKQKTLEHYKAVGREAELYAAAKEVSQQLKSLRPDLARRLDAAVKSYEKG